MDGHKRWNAYGWHGGFCFAKVMSFTCGWRGAPVKNGRSLSGAWASAQSLLSCWTSASHQAQPTHPLAPPPPPVTVSATARQQLALAVLALFYKQGSTKPPHGGFSFATWLGIAATAALSTPVALADCYSPESNGAHPPAVLKTWQHLHAANCSSTVLHSLSCAQHASSKGDTHVSDPATLQQADVNVTEETALTASKQSRGCWSVKPHSAQQFGDGSSLLPPSEPESFELNNPIWQCHHIDTTVEAHDCDAHQLSLTATEPLGVHVVHLSDSLASPLAPFDAERSRCKAAQSGVCCSDHADWPVLPTAASANECRECEPWYAVYAAAGHLWKHIEPAVAEYCKQAMTGYHRCRGGCTHQRRCSSSALPDPCDQHCPHQDNSCLDSGTVYVLDNINNAMCSSSTCASGSNCSSGGGSRHIHRIRGSCGSDSTRLSNNTMTSAKMPPLAVIPEEPFLGSACEALSRSCSLHDGESSLIPAQAANTIAAADDSELSACLTPSQVAPLQAANTTAVAGQDHHEATACSTTSEIDSLQVADSTAPAVQHQSHLPPHTLPSEAGVVQDLGSGPLSLSTDYMAEEVTLNLESEVKMNTICQEQSLQDERCEASGGHDHGLLGKWVGAAHVHADLNTGSVPAESARSGVSQQESVTSCSASSSTVLCGVERPAQTRRSSAQDCGASVACRASENQAEVFSQYLEWRQQILGAQGLELTLAVLGVPNLSSNTRNDIVKPESTLRLDEMPRVLQALEWDMQELQSQASIISDGLCHFTNHPAAESWEVAEGHLETLDEYFRKSCTIVGRMPPCSESSRSQVLQFVVPPLVQCSKVCSSGLAKLLSQQAQSAANIRGADVTEQLELVQRFVQVAAQITQDFRECEIVVPHLDYSQELGHAVQEVYGAFTASAKRLQTSAISGLSQNHSTRSTAELDRVLAMTKVWKEAHKLAGVVGRVWPEWHGSALSQVAECQKHAAEAFAKLLRSPQHAQHGARGKKASNAGAAMPQSPPNPSADEAGWNDKSVSAEEIARLKRVLDLLWSLLHYSKTTYKDLMQRKPQDKADLRRYSAIQQAFFDVALSLAKRSSRWTGTRVRTLQNGLLGDLKRCQSDVLRFIVEWDKSCVGVPGHKQMASLQEITCRLVRQYMALQRQSSRDSLSTPRNRHGEPGAAIPRNPTPDPPLHAAGNPTATAAATPNAPTHTSPFANPAAQTTNTTAAFNAHIVQDAPSSPAFLNGMYPYAANMLTQTPLLSPVGMMATPAFPIPAATLMGPVAATSTQVSPYALAAMQAPPTIALPNAYPLHPAHVDFHPNNPPTLQGTPLPGSVAVPLLNLVNTAQSPFASPTVQHHVKNEPNNSPFNDLALHSRLQSVVESLTPGRSTATASPADSTAIYLPPISESAPSTTHFSSTQTLNTHTTQTSHAMCSHTSGTTASSTAAVSTPTATSAHASDTAQHHGGDMLPVSVSAAPTAVTLETLHGRTERSGGAVSPSATTHVQHMLASPQRGNHLSLAAGRGGLSTSGMVAADSSDMFLTKEHSRGNGAESLLAATATNVADDFWGVKWEEVLGANVKEWFTGKTRLGRGSYGEVYKASYYHSDVAVKVLPIRSSTVHTVKQEIDVLRSTRHPNVVRFLGACLEPSTPGQSKPSRHLAIVMELCDIGTLHATISKARHLATRKRDPRVMHFYSSWSTRLDIARGIAAGTAFLHSRHVVHRDLTSYNVLLHYGVPWQAKVADFGLSRDASGPELNYSGDLHSPGWRAPELLVPNSKYTMKADVYSFGVILWELVTLRQPWEEEFDKAQQAGPRGNLPLFIKNEVVTGARLRFPEPDQLGGDLQEAAQVINLAERCWRSNPDDRPSMEEVVKKLEKIIAQVRRRR